MTRLLLVSLVALVSLGGCCGSDYLHADEADRGAAVEAPADSDAARAATEPSTR